MFKKSKAHFMIASSCPNLSPKDKWPADYFMGKLAEKSNTLPVSEVVKFYQKCGQSMEQAGCHMFRRIEAEDRKCLELFYRINRYLDKQRTSAYASRDFKKLHEIRILLEFFSTSANRRRSNGPSQCFNVDLDDALMKKMPAEVSKTGDVMSNFRF
jgi:hypothetical protein